MSPWLAQAFDVSGAEVWLEPFGGGAGAALTLLAAHEVEEAWIVEAHPGLAAFWADCTREPEALAKRIEHTTVDLAVFDWARSQLANRGDDLAFATFVINRCSHSGIVNTEVGPIGGRAQTGRYRIDARWNASALADRIRAVSALGDRFRVFAGDGIAFLEDLPGSGVESEVFAFVDPPYWRASRSAGERAVASDNRLYAEGVGPADHRRLADALHTLNGTPWVLTYDAGPEVARAYAGDLVREFEIPHSAGSSHVGSEYLVTPRELWTPGGNPLGKGRVWDVIGRENLAA
jgi:DNA adenine methylase